MVEWSTAPDSRLTCGAEVVDHSGTRKGAWVQIPLRPKFCIKTTSNKLQTTLLIMKRVMDVRYYLYPDIGMLCTDGQVVYIARLKVHLLSESSLAFWYS